MDHTLIQNDCDLSWKQFLHRLGVAPPDSLEKADYYFRQYQAGSLDVGTFLHFQLAEFAGRTPAEMSTLATRHFREVVYPAIYPAGREAVNRALRTGGPVVLLTATNEVVAAPLAAELRMPHLAATGLQIVAGCYTGELRGEYCGGEGKVQAARGYCNRFGLKLAQAAFYGDALADIPLLDLVGFPRVVNPVPALEKLAQAKNWPILRWKLEKREA